VQHVERFVMRVGEELDLQHGSTTLQFRE
jgi:hypothetical protein